MPLCRAPPHGGPHLPCALSAGKRLSGKTVYPFATNGGRIGHTLEDLEAACAGAAMREGIDIYFESHRMRTPKAQIERRIESFGK